MRSRRVIVLAAVFATVPLPLAGCFGGAGVAATPGGSVSAPATSGPPSGEPRPTPTSSYTVAPTGALRPTSPLAPTRSTGGVGETTISGEVFEGVEAGCRLLRSGGVDYLLVAGSGVDRAELSAGRKITVRGRPEPGLMTICQQGTPFRVTEVLAG